MKIKNFFYIILLVSLFACNEETIKTSDNVEFSVTVLIDYGESKNNKEEVIVSQKQLTTLEALQYVSIVETHPVGKHVFVSSIDSIQTIRGIKAWYYKVNGEPSEVLAIHNKINNGDTICWIYKQDICSPTVDNK